VTPYAHATFQFFLRNPICQEMGRKFKISFSATDEDTALSYMHDLGFIPKIKVENEQEVRGFKVLLGGGLGSQPRHADVMYEFLPEEKIIPTIEGVLRIFDRHGERAKRAKARLKFLVKDLGLEGFLALVEQEKQALAYQSYPIDTSDFEQPIVFQENKVPDVRIDNQEAFELWKKTNVFAQKQAGLCAVGIKVHLGDFYTDKARLLANLIKKYAVNELRFTLRQNILIRHVREEFLPFFYVALKKLGFAQVGYNSTLDITACPGTDTCNLGISSSTGIAAELEKVLLAEYSELTKNKDITIKISGCMNACGQHNMAHIGFQGMTVKSGTLIAPALQVLLGGGVLGNGQGRFADKVLKVPSKRGPQALRLLLNDFQQNRIDSEDFLSYYDRNGKTYFYDLLKHLSDTKNLTEDDFVDWGHTQKYVKAIGIGECAGVVIDLVATLLFESEEKLENAEQALNDQLWSDSIYHTYTSLINTAKAILTTEQLKNNTQGVIVKNFDEHFVSTGLFALSTSFAALVYQIRENKPSEIFAKNYLKQAKEFYQTADAYRLKQVSHA
jgi:sulfite reductase (ferredoxin)